MKLKLLLLLITVFLFNSCSKTDEKTSEQKIDSSNSVQKQIEEEVTGPKIKLAYKFKPGNKFSYRLKTVSENSEEIKADTTLTNKIKQSSTYRMDFTVKNVTEEFGTELDVIISSITADTDFNGQKINYDSKYIYSTRERAQFVDYEAVKKVPFKIFVNEIGQVTKVDNVNKIMNNILQIQQIPDTLSQKTKEQMKFNIGTGTLMPLTQQIFKVLSDEKVGVNSTWELKYSTPIAVFKVDNIAKFRITEFNFEQDSLVTIASTLTISSTGENKATENGVDYTFSEPKLTGSGKVIFNNSKGMVEKSESLTNLEMAMVMEGLDANKQKKVNTKKDFSKNTNIVELIK